VHVKPNRAGLGVAEKERKRHAEAAGADIEKRAKLARNYTETQVIGRRMGRGRGMEMAGGRGGGGRGRNPLYVCGLFIGFSNQEIGWPSLFKYLNIVMHSYCYGPTWD
jgi:hypothetical protein